MELGFGHALVGLVFTACCVYFNWKAGYRAGIVAGGSLGYDMAVQDTVSYLTKLQELSPHWKHQKISKSMIEQVARQGASDRGFTKEVETNA